MKNPKLAAQFVSRVRAAKPISQGSKNGRFSNSSSSSGDQDFSLHGSGQLIIEDDNTYVVKSDIRLAISAKSNQGPKKC